MLRITSELQHNVNVHPVDVLNVKFKMPVYVIHTKHKRLAPLSLCITPCSHFHVSEAWLTLIP